MGLHKILMTSKKDIRRKCIRMGWTPLSSAAEQGHEAVVKLLLETGKVDVDLKDGTAPPDTSFYFPL
jgi:hypothetical protein